jgi:uncharacterized membrane protein YebE (DUF533 family)
LVTSDDENAMTLVDEATFIALWTQGLESAAIGRQLGIPRGTVSSRAATLVRQGKIQPRPRGGAYPKQKALARQDGTPAHAPTPHPRVDIKQWTVRLSQALINAVKAQAAAEGKEPSHLVEEVLWQGLGDRRSAAQ